MPSLNNSCPRKKKKSNTLLAGGIAGFVESSICHPLDTIKTRMQLRNNQIESVGTRLKHSLVEPAVLHVRHSLVEPVMRFKHSLSEPSAIAAAALRPKHSLVEPANLVKLRRHSFVEPLSMQSSVKSADSSRSSSTAGVKRSSGWSADISKQQKAVVTQISGPGKRDPVIKVLPSTKDSAKMCWWNQPPYSSPSEYVANTSNGLSNKNSTAWWNWHKKSSTAITSRGQSSKSAAWYQPTKCLNTEHYGEHRSRRSHATLVKYGGTNPIRKGPLGPVQTARKIIQKEGFLSLYKGLSAVYVGIVPKMAIRFFSFEYYKDMIKRNTQLGDKSTNFIAGLSSGLTEAIIIVTPAEVCKIRMQSQRHSLLDPAEVGAPKYGNVVQTAITIIREEGYCALYKGVVPTMLRQGCNQAVNFTAYNSMKSYWLERQRKQQFYMNDENIQQPQPLPSTISMLIGGLSGAVGPIVNNPLDVVKTRLQKQNIAKNINIAPKYTGLFQACLKIAMEEGSGALWKGITPRLMRIVPGQAITFTTYEAICRWL